MGYSQAEVMAILAVAKNYQDIIKVDELSKLEYFYIHSFKKVPSVFNDRYKVGVNIETCTGDRKFFYTTSKVLIAQLKSIRPEEYPVKCNFQINPTNKCFMFVELED